MEGEGGQLPGGQVAVVADDFQDQDAVPMFEEAIKELGLHIGLRAQRPELESGNGPDVLWSLGGLKYLVIECKSGSTSASIWRSEVEQLAHSIDWFHAHYDESCEATPILIHPSRELDAKAVARPGTRIITFDKLNELRQALANARDALAAENAYRRPADVAQIFNAFSLTGRGFSARWTVAPRS